MTLVNAKEDADGSLDGVHGAHQCLGLEASRTTTAPSPIPACRAMCAFMTSTLAIRRRRRYCTMSRCTQSPVRRWRLSAPPAQAKPPSPTSSTAFMTLRTAKSATTASTSTRYKKADLRRSLGIVLQDTNLFTGTVMENIRYGNLDACDEECIAAAKLAGARRLYHAACRRAIRHHAFGQRRKPFARGSASCLPLPAPLWQTRR